MPKGRGGKSVVISCTSEVMDALYLKENINDAISDGLTAMVVQSPDDPIEFLGNYLLNYVDRQIVKKQVNYSMKSKRPFF